MSTPNRSHVHQLKRRGLTVLLWALCFFSVSQLGFRLALHFRPEIADREFGHKLASLQEQLSEQPNRPLVLMLGSSRAATGFRPESLPPLQTADGKEPLVFNFAQTGAGPVMTLLCLQRLLSAGVRPDWVLVEYWPAHWYGEYTAEIYLQQNLVNISCLGWKAMRLLGRFSAERRSFYENWCCAQLSPIVACRQALLSRYAKSWLPESARLENLCDSLSRTGWKQLAGALPSERYRQVMEHYRQIYAPRFRDLSPVGISDRALRQTLALCQRHGIQTAVVVLPEGSEFQSWYPVQVREEIEDYITFLKRELGLHVVDARDWSPDADFLDAHHLLPHGAAAFTHRLGWEVLQPLLLRNNKSFALLQ